MDKLIPAIKKNIKFKLPNQNFTIDNLIFRFHYRFTTALLFLASIMISCQELLGQQIMCIGNIGLPPSEREHGNIINRYCYYTSTFTVAKHMNESMLKRGDILYPGVGSVGNNLEDEEVKHHAYYQWVGYALFAQAFLFYFPHFIWKVEEGQRMRNLVNGLEYAAFTYDNLEISLKVGDKTIPSAREVNDKVTKLKVYFQDSLRINQHWTLLLFGCELLNLLNIICNISFNDYFLDGQFLTLGPNVIRYGLDSPVDPLDIVFPKITKCTYYKFGSSGNLQAMDIMCVMSLNIFNEKAYTLFWFWFMFLLSMSILIVIWRIICLCLYSRSRAFNKLVFSYCSNACIDIDQLMNVTKSYNYGTWTFLAYLAKNLTTKLFVRFVDLLDEDYKANLIDWSDGGSSRESGTEKLKLEELCLKSEKNC